MMQPSRNAASFGESAIREMTRLINLYHPDDGINLAQGFPDFAAPAAIKQAAAEAIAADLNQYATTWGTPALRSAIAEATGAAWGRAIDPDDEVTVCCGATESMLVAIMAMLNPGDEVIVFAPSYENYGPDTVLAGGTPRYVRLHAPDWHIDRDELAAAFGPRTRGIVVNTPHNPTGKVFSRDELLYIAELCLEHDALCFTDEIYEHMVYEGEHIAMATLPEMAERTLTISGLSKTFSVTGWRVGHVISPRWATPGIRKVHDFVSCGAAHPLQAAGAAALNLGAPYFQRLRAEYQERRDYIVPVLQEAGFRCSAPAGAYYVMTDITDVLGRLGFADDTTLARYLVEEVGVAAVPGSSFYPDPAREGRTELRFAFCKRMETLRRAALLLTALER